MTKTKKRKKRWTTKRRRSKKKGQIKIRVGLGIALFLLVMGLWLYRHHFHVSNSYQVTQTATITPADSVTLYQGFFDFKQQKLTQAATVQVKHYYLTYLKGQSMTLAKIDLDGKTYYINAKQLHLQQTNTINQYIAGINYPHVAISKSIDQQFAKMRYFTTKGQPKGVIIHDTGNDDSSIQSEVSYMSKNYKSVGVFVHSFIDKDSILQIADLKYMAQGAGPKANPYYIQFEMTHEHSAEDFARQTANAAYFTALMLKKYQLPVTLGQKNGAGTVWTHALVSTYLGGTDHQDPDDYWNQAASDFFNSDYSVKNFIDLIQAYYNQL